MLFATMGKGRALTIWGPISNHINHFNSEDILFSQMLVRLSLCVFDNRNITNLFLIILQGHTRTHVCVCE